MDAGVETPGPWRTAPFSWRDDPPLLGVEPAPAHLAKVQIVYQVGRHYAGRALAGAPCTIPSPFQRSCLTNSERRGDLTGTLAGSQLGALVALARRDS